MVLMFFPKKSLNLLMYLTFPFFHLGQNTITENHNKMLVCSFHKNHPMEMRVVIRESFFVYVHSQAVIRTLH